MGYSEYEQRGWIFPILLNEPVWGFTIAVKFWCIVGAQRTSPFALLSYPGGIAAPSVIPALLFLCEQPAGPL